VKRRVVEYDADFVAFTTIFLRPIEGIAAPVYGGLFTAAGHCGRHFCQR
jgi:hypothetical protein